MGHPYKTRGEFWAYLATFLHTTQTAPIREPYLDLDAILQGKDFFILTTNQDTQFVKIYPEEKVAQIQGDHRFFQCSKPCCDRTWDAVKPVEKMIEAMGDGTSIPEDLIPRCPVCGAEAFPWVRGYGNFLQMRTTATTTITASKMSVGSAAASPRIRSCTPRVKPFQPSDRESESFWLNVRRTGTVGV